MIYIYTLTEQRRIGHLNPMVKQLMSHEEKNYGIRYVKCKLTFDFTKPAVKG